MKMASLTLEQIMAAKRLNEGLVIASYNDNGRIRIETEDGINPYVWRDGRWVPTVYRGY